MPSRSAPILLLSSSALARPRRRSRRPTPSSSPPAPSGATSTTARTRAPPGAPSASTTRRGRRARPSSATATATRTPSSRSAATPATSSSPPTSAAPSRPAASPPSPPPRCASTATTAPWSTSTAPRSSAPTCRPGPISLHHARHQRVAREHVRPDPIDPSLLVEGANVLAVEIHQTSVTSSDISFDLELDATDGIEITRGPYLQLATPSSIVVRWRTNVASSTRVLYGTTLLDLDQSVTERGAHHRARRPADEPRSRHALLLRGRHHHRDPGRRHRAVHVRDRAAARNAPADPRLGARRLRHRRRQRGRGARCLRRVQRRRRPPTSG